MNSFFIRPKINQNRIFKNSKLVRFCKKIERKLEDEKNASKLHKAREKRHLKKYFYYNCKPGFEVYGILAVIRIMSYSQNVSVIK